MSRTADPTAKIALLRAAEEVFAEKGVDHAKVEDIARAAGISKGAFYLHFESKEALLRQVVESFLGRMSAQFVLQAETPDEPEALLSLWLERDLECFEFLWQSRAILGILATCAGDYQYLTDAFRAECRSTAAKWIALLKESGLVRKDVDAEMTALLMNGAYNELVMRLLTERSHPELRAWLVTTRELFVRGIGTPPLVAALKKDREKDRASGTALSPGRRGPHGVTRGQTASGRRQGTRNGEANR